MWPMIIGATIGALADRKNPVRGATIGATLGFGGSAAFGAGASGSAGGILGGATKTAATGTAASTVPATAATGLKAGTSYAPGTIESIMGKANAAGTYTNPDYYANIMGNQVYTGNEGLLSQIGTGANSIFDSTKTSLGEYATPQNLIGVSNLLGGMNQAQPIPSAGGGGAQGGTPPKFEPFVTGQVYGRKKRGNA